ncbi:uncharacterized protein LOC110604491 [Manihot esculenta]|uniref:Senescence regulator n=1 Tax=Manihot esculenta TaxID=3983 RepID=A0A2C9U4Y5_MANES|nr:uncharacterized protein LOC110604491 [Manihot esculenta]OAY24723.1 hypothetical protein MANES_17G038700v8 [Manihot esculenta]
MAKGRRLTTSRSERLLGSFSYSNGQDTTVNDSSELAEEDMWSMVDDATHRNDQINYNSHGEWNSRADVESNGNMSIRSRRRIPRDRDDQHVGGLSLAFQDSSSKTASSRIVHQLSGHDNVAPAASSPRHMATSAPVNVPDWSNILRVDSVESLHESDDGYDDRDSEMVPPHEYLAREYARSKKMGGASVFEGVGRTLKGRDMRRVRDAVWSQTGFDG